MDRKILILFAHPALEKSRINIRLIKDLDTLPGVTFHDLYQQYPDLDIDIAHEQKLLSEHDLIVFHFPFYWYSTPSILKEWQDLVLTHGWAYGSKGNALKGKWFMNVITTGGQENAYLKDGYNRNTIRQLILPLEQTAKLCKMIYLPPFVVHGTHSISIEDLEANHKELKTLYTAFTKSEVNFQGILNQDRINFHLENILTNTQTL